MKKVLVTGGAGYIGSHTVVELAAAGYTPIIVDNFSNSERSVLKALEEITGDVIHCHDVDCRDENALNKVFSAEGTIAGVLHFAAFKAVGESVAQPLQYFENNIGSLLAVLKAMRHHDVNALVFSSSCTVYGEPEDNPVTEATPWKPANSPYGYTKQVCERLIADLQSSDQGIRAVTLRYFNPIGAHPSALIGELPLGPPNNLIPYLTQVAAGIRPELTIFGNDYPTPDGTCIRDYIHVVDLARAHVQALKYIESQSAANFNLIANVGTGNGVSVQEIVDTFELATGVKVPHRIGERRPGDVSEVFAGTSEALRALDWEPAYTLEDALNHAWKWQEALAKRNKTN